MGFNPKVIGAWYMLTNFIEHFGKLDSKEKEEFQTLLQGVVSHWDDVENEVKREN